MFKVYYNNKIILFTERETKEKSFTKISFLDEDKIKFELNIFLNIVGSGNINIYGKEFLEVPNIVKSQFVFIRAAGGVVKDSSGRILVIDRLGHLDFPKGKVEKLEIDEDAATREVCEECGIQRYDLILEHKIKNVYHIYPYKSGFALKETAWFLMTFTENYELTPQIEENIVSVSWINPDEINIFKARTYPSLHDLLDYI